MNHLLPSLDYDANLLLGTTIPSYIHARRHVIMQEEGPPSIVTCGSVLGLIIAHERSSMLMTRLYSVLIHEQEFVFL